MSAKRVVMLIVPVLAVLGFSSGARADEQWRENHPRRAQVNDRLENQNERIKEGVKDGKLTPGQAKQLHAEDHQIRQQEREMAAKNGGHITKTEQKALNQEENQTSKQIYNEKHGK